jgi:hypothetical protein
MLTTLKTLTAAMNAKEQGVKQYSPANCLPAAIVTISVMTPIVRFAVINVNVYARTIA